MNQTDVFTPDEARVIKMAVQRSIETLSPSVIDGTKSFTATEIEDIKYILKNSHSIIRKIRQSSGYWSGAPHDTRWIEGYLLTVSAKNSKRSYLHIAIYIALIALAFWFIETAYFGFNILPSCMAERACDFITIILSIISNLFLFIWVVNKITDK